MITEEEMDNISEEITYIEGRLNILSLNNSIESQERRRLLRCLDFLEYQLISSLIFLRKRGLHLQKMQ